MQGTAPIKDLCRQAKKLGYQSIALTDTDNLCGMWDFIRECNFQGLQPVIGAEITDPQILMHRAVCLVKTMRGYSNLTRLITSRHRDRNFSLKSALPVFSVGLAVLTWNMELLTFWHARRVDLGVNLARHPLSQQNPLCTAARRLGIPMVATPGSIFLNRKDIKIHRMHRAIDSNTCLSRLVSKGDTVPDSAFLSSPEVYQEKFKIVPQAIHNSFVLKEKLEFQGPDFGIVMPPWRESINLSSATLLFNKTMRGARKRYGFTLSRCVIDRIDYELAVIERMNFCEYFLVVEKIVKHASQICGRGSGAASIVAYCLGITNVCPLKYNLSFERFLNLERKDSPDIDIDFAWDERDAVLNWVLNNYKEHAGMVSSHIMFQPRMAVREVAKVFGLPEAEISKVSKRLPWFWKTDEAGEELIQRIQHHPEFRFMDFPKPWPEIMEYAAAITGTPRYLSVHPGGVVITPDPIDTYVPLETAPKGVALIQWEKDSTEEAGLVKIDLLGNRSLGVIRDCIENITEACGKFEDFQLKDPEDDYETQQNVAQGNTMGCFYIESPAMRLLQKKTMVGDFEHVVIHSSIIRPAANEFIRKYIERLHSGIWKPVHPLLEDILSETYGIMVYQEDVSRVAEKIAGFSHAEGDGLRKIVSKKDKKRELKDYYIKFKNGAVKKGVNLTDIKFIWSMIVSFSGYSFCKPHSASYARVSFQAAYLKTHYPAHFMAAVISNGGGFYSTFAYVSEAKRLNIEILHPDVNKSSIQWRGSGFKIRVGLQAIRDLSEKTMKTIMEERKKQRFSGLEDFFSRVNPQENEVRSLIHSGSLDSLDDKDNRAVILWVFAIWQKQNRNMEKQPSLFKNIKQKNLCPGEFIPDLPKDECSIKLRREFRVLGFLCKSHPIVLYENIIKKHNAVKAENLSKFIGRDIISAGWLITGKVVKTRYGEPMKFFTFEDETGIIETVFFPKPYAFFCHMLEYCRPYILSGRVDSDWGAVTLVVHSVKRVSV